MAITATNATLPDAVELTDEERGSLLDIARRALAAATRGSALPTWHRMRRTGGAFVTLTKHGRLRACIGNLDATRPLDESVALAALGAALHDWRFGPVAPAELPALSVEISILGPVVRLDDPLAFRVGIDGLIVQRGAIRGLLLPEVATQNRFDAATMLEETCRKAGLGRTAWREDGTTVWAFRTARFGGPVVLAPVG